MISVEKILRDRNQEANIKKFTFKCRLYMKPSRVTSSISFLLKCNVEEMKLHLDSKSFSIIPASLFTSKSLISLHLKETKVTPRVGFPKYISLPKLKILTLNEITFTGKCEQLFAGCHVLEELNIWECTFAMREFCISAPLLKTLVIDNSKRHAAEMEDCILNIHAHGLLSLKYTTAVAKDYVLSNFVAPVEAHFLFSLTGDETMEQKVNQNAAVSKLLGAFSHVKCLSVIAPPVHHLFVSEDLLNKLPTFHKLNRLELYHVTSDGTVIELLKVSPYLENLVFCLFVDEDYTDGDVEGFHTSFPHLKSVSFEVEDHDGHPRELRWMKLILKNAIALEKMSICYDLEGLERRQEFMEEIRNVPRASSVCLVEFSQ
ncbi:putative F-box protein At1g58310 isoform X2 [Papaver somniferum]|nr:putative F-box protein At1g58310 isoform X2 [Papaver somniferum]